MVITIREDFFKSCILGCGVLKLRILHFPVMSAANACEKIPKRYHSETWPKSSTGGGPQYSGVHFKS